MSLKATLQTLPVRPDDPWLERLGSEVVRPLGLSAIQARTMLEGQDLRRLQGLPGGDGLASASRGRLGALLTVTLFGDGARDTDELHAIEDLSRQEAATQLQIEILGREPTDHLPPALPGELGRYVGERLYRVDLTRPAGSLSYSTNTRRNINKARKAGATFERSRSEAALQAHQHLTGASLERRAGRGEDTSARALPERVQQLIRNGQGELFQVRLGEDIVSSNLVFSVGADAFYYDGGSSSVGMEAGTSHLLMSHIIDGLRAEGVQSLNLGIARTGNVGLMRFKEGFDAELWFVQRVLMDRKTPWRQLQCLWRHLRA